MFRRLHLPLAGLRAVLLRLLMVAGVLFPRYRRTVWVLAVPVWVRLFVAVCAGSARLFAIVLYWLRSLFRGGVRL